MKFERKNYLKVFSIFTAILALNAAISPKARAETLQTSFGISLAELPYSQNYFSEVEGNKLKIIRFFIADTNSQAQSEGIYKILENFGNSGVKATLTLVSSTTAYSPLGHPLPASGTSTLNLGKLLTYIKEADKALKTNAFANINAIEILNEWNINYTAENYLTEYFEPVCKFLHANFPGPKVYTGGVTSPQDLPYLDQHTNCADALGYHDYVGLPETANFLVKLPLALTEWGYFNRFQPTSPIPPTQLFLNTTVEAIGKYRSLSGHAITEADYSPFIGDYYPYHDIALAIMNFLNLK